MYLEQIKKATHYIQSKYSQPIDLAIILGSGLNEFAETIKDPVILNYKEIPHFPLSTIEGHAGKMYLGMIGQKSVLVMKGRVHYYEGYDMKQITFPIRLFASLHIPSLILTNACGGISEHLNPGQITLMTDHLSLFCPSPLRGPNLDEFGPRFKDMTTLYTPEYQEVARQASLKTQVSLKEGVYAFYPGPQFETPADIRALRVLGADMVGMSTVPEAIVARHCDMKILGLSLVTNKAAGLSHQALSHQEVQEEANKVAQSFISLMTQIVIDL